MHEKSVCFLTERYTVKALSLVTCHWWCLYEDVTTEMECSASPVTKTPPPSLSAYILTKAKSLSI